MVNIQNSNQALIELKGYPEDLVAKLTKVKPALKVRKFQNKYMKL